MQLPVVVLGMQITGPGSRRLYVTELRQGVHMLTFCKSIEHFLFSQNNSNKSKPSVTNLPRESLSLLYKLASSESDRLLMKYTERKSQGMSSKEARKIYGFENFHGHEEKIMDAISMAESIRKSILELSQAENVASLRALGIPVPDDESESAQPQRMLMQFILMTAIPEMVNLVIQLSTKKVPSKNLSKDYL